MASKLHRDGIRTPPPGLLGRIEMPSAHRSLFRTPSASLKAAVLIILSGGAAGACAADANGDGSVNTAQAVTGGDQCQGVQLDASRQYKPKSFNDAHVAFGAGTLTFAVPS